MVRMNVSFYIINLAAEEKTKRKNIILNSSTVLHESEGNTKIKLKKDLLYFFFSIFQKIGSGGSVKRKIKNSGLNSGSLHPKKEVFN